MVADGANGRAEPASYGDVWQGRTLNKLIPLLERHGYRVVDGSVDITGFEVRRGGQTVAIKLLTPTTLSLHAVDDDDAPSDQYPGWAYYSPDDDATIAPND